MFLECFDTWVLYEKSSIQAISSCCYLYLTMHYRYNSIIRVPGERKNWVINNMTYSTLFVNKILTVFLQWATLLKEFFHYVENVSFYIQIPVGSSIIMFKFVISNNLLFTFAHGQCWIAS